MNGAERDVLVIGAGVFGAWTARALHAAGLRVSVIDAAAPGHDASASGGESRITRCMYGAESLYTEWALRSAAEWRALSDRSGEPLVHETGVLWLHRPGDQFAAASRRALAEAGIPLEALGSDGLRRRYPVLFVDDGDEGLLEVRGGALRAAAAIRTLGQELAASGVEILQGRIGPIRTEDGRGGTLQGVRTQSGETLRAERYVVAAGAWLDRLCPDAMADRLFVTRQEVLFFDVAPAATTGLPVWADMPYYGFPPIAGHGFKVANDRHGPRVADVDVMDRDVGEATVEDARDFLRRRFPSLADAPFAGGTVCQYANSWNGDFLVDLHPGLANVWLAGCGSGHGYKHGPALGAHVAGRVLDSEPSIPRFSLKAKQRQQSRSIQ